MRKKLLSTLGVVATSLFTYAQVGINTNNPQTILHVDGAKDNSATGVPSVAQQTNDFVVTATGNTGIGTNAPTQKIDVATGNVRIRDITTNIGVGGTDRVVVADATGILKTVNFADYSLFHARLANSQSHIAGSGTGNITTLLFAAPLATSPYYNYNTSTGTLTFTQPGNYLVTLQAGFASAPAGTQLLIGIRPVPDADYLGRGSHYNAVSTSSTIGELMNYTTMIIVPSIGYRIRFTAAPNANCTILSTETGSTGSGNVTNVTVQKI
ncbi:hypothetical protein HNP38_000134 [Chryseobacterium defluvii]|uniref:C1q domain-containing protein n=1 Tax=Chryseobacterium defluvii TaxID=160396 RepID=A0A840KCZ9_9FLAO|nr:hypothetical protein [Chryseobacterium defluvii]MBB4804862.1 hypothetical protein [Chryseobacterium defluvii]